MSMQPIPHSVQGNLIMRVPPPQVLAGDEENTIPEHVPTGGVGESLKSFSSETGFVDVNVPGDVKFGHIIIIANG